MVVVICYLHSMSYQTIRSSPPTTPDATQAGLGLGWPVVVITSSVGPCCCCCCCFRQCTDDQALGNRVGFSALIDSHSVSISAASAWFRATNGGSGASGMVSTSWRLKYLWSFLVKLRLSANKYFDGKSVSSGALQTAGSISKKSFLVGLEWEIVFRNGRDLERIHLGPIEECLILANGNDWVDCTLFLDWWRLIGWNCRRSLTMGMDIGTHQLVMQMHCA